jgi:hypothetical protein
MPVTFKTLFIGLAIISFVSACGPFGSRLDEALPELASLGEEIGGCRIEGVESPETFVMPGNDDLVDGTEFSGSLGIGLILSQGIEITETGEDEFEVTGFSSEGVTLTNETTGDELDVEVSVSALPDSAEWPNLYVGGVENPDETTVFTLFIPAGNVTCTDGSVTTSDYEVRITVAQSSIVHSCDSSECMSAEDEEPVDAEGNPDPCTTDVCDEED